MYNEISCNEKKLVTFCILIFFKRFIFPHPPSCVYISSGYIEVGL